MEYLNRNTKKAKDFIRRYERATARDIYDAYKKPSQAKINAERRIYERDAHDEYQSAKTPYLSRVSYSGYKIIGANCSYFTIARIMDVYGYGDENGTVVNSYLIVDTPSNTYQIWLYD